MTCLVGLGLGFGLGCGDSFTAGQGGGGATTTTTTATTTATGAGGTGGAGASTGTAGGGGGGAGEPLSDCGSRNFGARQPLFYTTLDNLGSVSTPEWGDGTDYSFGTALSFVSALNGDGVQFTGTGQYIAWRQLVGVPNIDTVQGTLDFCFRPAWSSTDGQLHLLFAINTAAGSFRVTKTAAGEGNAIVVTASKSDGGIPAVHTRFGAAAFSFVDGTWHRLTITWNYGALDDEQQVHLYVDGEEISPEAGFGTGPFPVDAPSPEHIFAIGGTPVGGSSDGTYDELVIHPEPVPP